MLNGKLPATVGVPVITPAELKERPKGSAPEVTEYAYGLAPPFEDSVAL